MSKPKLHVSKLLDGTALADAKRIASIARKFAKPAAQITIDQNSLASMRAVVVAGERLPKWGRDDFSELQKGSAVEALCEYLRRAAADDRIRCVPEVAEFLAVLEPQLYDLIFPAGRDRPDAIANAFAKPARQGHIANSRKRNSQCWSDKDKRWAVERARQLLGENSGGFQPGRAVSALAQVVHEESGRRIPVRTLRGWIAASGVDRER